MEKEIYISADGLAKIKIELAEIENVKLKDIAYKIAEAKDLGDLSENAEYHEAKEQQAFLYGKAQELKYKLRHAKIINNSSCAKNEIGIGCTVTLKNSNEKVDYTLVGSDEADPMSGKISFESPIGASLIGHKVGDTVEVKTPSGSQMYEIAGIS